MSGVVKLAERGELEGVIRDALAWLDQNNLVVFWRSIALGEGFLHADWYIELEPRAEKFLHVAKISGAEVVFIDCTLCHVERFEPARTEDPEDEQGRLLARVSAHDGEVVEVSLSWARDRILFKYTRSASWSDDYFDLCDRTSNGDGDEPDDEEDDDGLDEGEVRRYAEVLAKDSRFQAGRSKAQHLYAARRVLKADVVVQRELLAAVIDEAKSIYDLELKPTQERAHRAGRKAKAEWPNEGADRPEAQDLSQPDEDDVLVWVAGGQAGPSELEYGECDGVGVRNPRSPGPVLIFV